MLKKILLTTVFAVVLFNKVILSQIILINFKTKLDIDIVIKNIDISYIKGFLIIKDVNVFKKSKSKNLNIFYAEKIYTELDLSSLFSTLIIIKNLDIYNGKLYINLETSKINEIINDNLSILENKQNKNPKIYPKKMIDINFLIKKFRIINSKVEIKENNKYKTDVILPDMNFSLFGNEKNYLHYKDVFKIILINLFMKIPDQKLRDLIEETYKIKQF